MLATQEGIGFTRGLCSTTVSSTDSRRQGDKRIAETSSHRRFCGICEKIGIINRLNPASL